MNNELTLSPLTVSCMNFIDLFAGIGGIRLGFEGLFGKNVFSSEWDKHAQTTYQANFAQKSHGDITEIKAEDIPNHDILLAGFPCQPFSNAGLKKGFEDARGTLFFHIARIIAHHQPSILFLENVKGLKSHNHGTTYKTIEKILEELGYNLHVKILNAKNYGAVQNRERIYIVAFRENIDFRFPEPIVHDKKLGDILEPSPLNKYTISDRMWSGHQKRKEAHIAKGNGFGYSIFNKESKYTSTISARYYKDGSEILIEQEGKNPRVLTPREAARLQGFPDSFQIPVSDNQAYRQFGNSVYVPIVRAIAEKIKIAIENPRAIERQMNLFYDHDNRQIAPI